MPEVWGDGVVPFHAQVELAGPMNGSAEDMAPVSVEEYITPA